MELQGRQTVLRSIQPDDAPALAAILAEPAVARWWGTFGLDRVEAQITGGADPDEEGFAILVDHEIVGYIQLVEEPEPDFRQAGIDLFLAASAPMRSGRSLRT